MPDAGLMETIRQLLHLNSCHGEGRREARARPRIAGIPSSKRRVLRRMREIVQPAPSRAGPLRRPRAHAGTITPVAVDVMRGTDLTTAITGQGPVAV